MRSIKCVSRNRGNYVIEPSSIAFKIEQKIFIELELKIISLQLSASSTPRRAIPFTCSITFYDAAVSGETDTTELVREQYFTRGPR